MKYFDLKKYLGKNRAYVWIFLGVLVITSIACLSFVLTRDYSTRYVSSSTFKVINGDKTYNLYRGTYHKITTFADVASVVRSNEVIREVITKNSFDSTIEDIRENIDIYEIGDMVFQLDFIWADEQTSSAINISIIDNYHEVIESRMDDDNRDLFDVQILEQPEVQALGDRITHRIISSFLFSFFCGIMIILIMDILKKIIYRKKIAKRSQ